MENARALTLRLKDLLARERVALAEFLIALADFDAKRLWAELDHTSLFYFLHRELGLSKGAAFYRKTAAELIQRFPEVVEPLRDGRLCLMTVTEVAKVLTPENRHEVLPRFFHLSKTEAKEVSAEIRPVEAAPRRDVITAEPLSMVASVLPLSKASIDFSQSVQPVNHSSEASGGMLGAPLLSGAPADARAPAPAAAAAAAASIATDRRDSIDPLSAFESRIHVTVARAFLKKLDAARDALSHSHPGASIGEILEVGLDLVLVRDAKRKGLVENPRPEPPPSSPDHIPAHVKRAVWIRDEGRCQWKMASGEICGSTCRIQFDHVDSRGLGGIATVETTRLLCMPHNDEHARQVYGDDWMDRYTRGRRAKPPDVVREPVAAYA